MAILYSKVEKIAKLWIYAPSTKGKAVSVKKAWCDGRDFMAVGTHGQIYTNMLKDFAYTASDAQRMDFVMKALLRLKVITKDEMDEHMRNVRANDDARRLRYDRERFAELKKRYPDLSILEQETV